MILEFPTNSVIGYTNGLVIVIFLLIIFWCLHRLEQSQDKRQQEKMLDDFVALDSDLLASIKRSRKARKKKPPEK